MYTLLPIVAALATAEIDIPAGVVKITTLDGKTVEGAVVVKVPGIVYLKKADGKTVKIRRADIVDVVSVTPKPTDPGPTPDPGTDDPAPPPRLDLAAYKQKLREMHPTTAEAWHTFGAWCFAHGYPVRGELAFKKSLSLDGASALPRQMELADLLAKSGRQYEARELLATLVRANPDSEPVRAAFNKLSDQLERDMDALVREVKALYRAGAYAKVLQALVPKVRSAHKIFLETLSVKVHRALALALDELMVDCRMKLAEKDSAVLRRATPYEKPIIARRLETDAEQAYKQIPSYVIMRLTDPRYQRPPYNRYPYVLRRAQRDQYLKAAEEAKRQYTFLLQFRGGDDPAATKAVQEKLAQIAKAITALRKAKVR